jgi:hypothetical protein
MFGKEQFILLNYPKIYPDIITIFVVISPLPTANIGFLI